MPRKASDQFYLWNLRRARIGKNFTGGDIARRAGISTSQYHAYESLRRIPSDPIKTCLAEAVNVDKAELFPENLRDIVTYVKQERSKPTLSEHIVTDIEEISEILEDPSPEVAEKIYQKGLLQRAQKEISHLKPYTERAVLMLRYGFAGRDPHTLEELGRLFKVSRETIRRIETKALEKLRRRII